MSRAKVIAPFVIVAAVIGIGIGIVSCGGSNPKPTPPANESARDCWAHPDKAGHRHCYSGKD